MYSTLVHMTSAGFRSENPVRTGTRILTLWSYFAAVWFSMRKKTELITGGPKGNVLLVGFRASASINSIIRYIQQKRLRTFSGLLFADYRSVSNDWLLVKPPIFTQVSRLFFSCFKMICFLVANVLTMGARYRVQS